jgi:hypothetical protein
VTVVTDETMGEKSRGRANAMVARALISRIEYRKLRPQHDHRDGKVAG